MCQNCLLKQCKPLDFLCLKKRNKLNISWPFDHRVTPFYELMYLYTIFIAVVTQFGISGTDALLLDIYLHISALMKILARDLDNLEQRCFGKESQCTFYHVAVSHAIFEF